MLTESWSTVSGQRGSSVPVGWPLEVPAPDHPEFVVRAVAWMLDLGAPEWRMSPVWRDYPLALAHRLRHEIEGRREGARSAYATARASLAEDSADIARVLEALEAEGAQLAARAREADLIHEALSGRRWRERL